MQAYNSLEQLDHLRSSGIKDNEAEAIIKAIERIINNSDNVTQQDLETLKKEIKFELISLKVDLQNFIVKAVMTTIMILSSLQTLYHFYH